MEKKLALYRIPVDEQASNYQMDPRLARAVELAIALDKPLLVSGEPGTGKTQLAKHVAHLLAEQTFGGSVLEAPFLSEPVEFFTKSTSTAMDLFYKYDAVSHFRDKSDRKTSAYVDFEALGLARVIAHGRKSDALINAEIAPLLKNCPNLKDEPQSSVVLIDEIDKAPKEFPNDLLNEMASGEFRIRELDFSLKRPQNNARVVVIMTSNFEKSLPSAFLRRCVFYHIPFPDNEQLLKIVEARLKLSETPAIKFALDRFRKFRDEVKQTSNRVPSTAEFLDWLRVLKADGLLEKTPFPPAESHADWSKYKSSLAVLQKENIKLDRNPLLT